MRNCVFWDQSSNFPACFWHTGTFSLMILCLLGRGHRVQERWEKGGVGWRMGCPLMADQRYSSSRRLGQVRERDGTGSWQLLMFQDHLRLVVGGRGGSLFICCWQVCCTVICSLCLLPLDWKMFNFLLSCLPVPPLRPPFPPFFLRQDLPM